MLIEDWPEVAKRLEPDAAAGGGDQEPLFISIAVSLKRIADRLELNSNTYRSADGSPTYGEFRVSGGRG